MKTTLIVNDYASHMMCLEHNLKQVNKFLNLSPLKKPNNEIPINKLFVKLNLEMERDMVIKEMERIKLIPKTATKEIIIKADIQRFSKLIINNF